MASKSTAQTSVSTEGTSVLFVCLGNICRSPMAEAVFRHRLSQYPDAPSLNVSRIDSCGTGAWHVGSDPDPRTMSTLRKNGISYSHAARKISSADFQNFDFILGMDADNLENLQAMRKDVVRKSGSEAGIAKVQLFGDYGGQSKREEVDDPYYGGGEGFTIAFEQLNRFSDGLIAEIERRAGITR